MRAGVHKRRQLLPMPGGVSMRSWRISIASRICRQPQTRSTGTSTACRDDRGGHLALVAIAFAEPERAVFRAAILQAGNALISTASALEFKMIVYGRRGLRALVLADDMLRLP